MVALLYQCTSIRFMTVVKDHAIYIFYAKQRPVLFAFEYIFIPYRIEFFMGLGNKTREYFIILKDGYFSVFIAGNNRHVS